jgi:hypothetical protein
VLISLTTKYSVVLFLLSDSRASEIYCRRFGTLGFFHLKKWCKLTPPIKVEQPMFRNVSDKIKTPGNHPKERIQPSEDGEMFTPKYSNLFQQLFVSMKVN